MADHRDNSLIDWYAQLDIRPDASHAEIVAAYRRLARALHPDSAEPDSVDLERLQRVLEARAVLSDPTRRRDYDTRRQLQTTSLRTRERRGCPVCCGTRTITTPCASCCATGFQRSTPLWLSTPRPCLTCQGTRQQRVTCGACGGTGATSTNRQHDGER